MTNECIVCYSDRANARCTKCTCNVCTACYKKLTHCPQCRTKFIKNKVCRQQIGYVLVQMENSTSGIRIKFRSLIDRLAYSFFHDERYLTQEIYDLVGFGKSLYEEGALTTRRFNMLYHRIVDIMYSHDNGINDIGKSLNFHNYTYIELLEKSGDDFGWVKTSISEDNPKVEVNNQWVYMLGAHGFVLPQ